MFGLGSAYVELIMTGSACLSKQGRALQNKPD